ncbi:hypothetical protein A7J71_17755 [Achromobacter insolitus]|nr:hypothetical protein A7J71_17755 [Achromobacter insolitus]OCZ50694.1 hypothetical protein A7P22_15575 [Achromobacter insolitus]
MCSRSRPAAFQYATCLGSASRAADLSSGLSLDHAFSASRFATLLGHFAHKSGKFGVAVGVRAEFSVGTSFNTFMLHLYL